jgi:hypothetical protein
VITNYSRFTREIRSRISMDKASFNKTTFPASKMNINVVECQIWSMAICGAETWTFRKIDGKYLENSEIWCWRRMEKISWTYRVRNVAVLRGVQEEGNIIRTVKRMNAAWIGHILCGNCLLKHVIEGELGDGSAIRRRKRLLDDLKKIEGAGTCKRKH